MEDHELTEAAHRSLMRFNAVTTELEGGEVAGGDGELLYAGPHPFLLFNGAMREAEGTGWAETIPRAAEWFGAMGRGFLAFGRPGEGDLAEVSREAGLSELMRYPEMVRTEAIEPLAPPPGAELRPVEDARACRDYWAICAAAYVSLGFPPDVFEAMSDELLLDDSVDAVLAYLDGSPVAAAMVWTPDDLGLVAWVGTVEAARGSGLAAALTVEVTNRAFARGARAAHLQASPMGEPVYLRLGYRELFSYSLYASPPSEPA